MDRIEIMPYPLEEQTLMSPMIGILAHDCRRIWDPVEARFEACILPVICAAPLALILFLLMIRVLRPTLRRPRWLRPFIAEECEIGANFEDNGQKAPAGRYPSLMLISAFGLLPQVLTILHDGFEFSSILLGAAWFITLSLVVITRSRTIPFSLLAVYGSLFVSSFVPAVQNVSKARYENVLSWMGPFASGIAIALILPMPLRDPELAHDGISPAFSKPDPELRSPEDNLTLWQFMTVSWMAPLISMGASRQLHDRDVWLLGHEFQHKALHDSFGQLKGTVFKGVVLANAVDLIIVALLGILELCANLSIPILLQQLLRSMADLHAPARPVMIYALLSLTARLIAGQSAVFSLWFSRRSFERSRGEMITTLYEKMLKRKVTSYQAQTVNNNVTADGKDQDGSTEADKQSASMGKVINLMRGDVYEVAQRFWESSSLTNVPLGLILSAVLIWRLIGWSCLVGVLAILLAQVANTIFARILIKCETRRRSATDSKLHIISQFVEAIRHLRWYGWQDAWLAQIMKARQHELNLRIIASIWGILMNFTNAFASGLFPVISFYAYTYLAGQPLRVDIAFPALELFRMLDNNLRQLPNLLTALVNAYVAVKRLEAFMNEPNKPEEILVRGETAVLELKNASFAWPGTGRLVLQDVNLTFTAGLNIVCGKVASGKTALLMALLGELDRRQGDVLNPTKSFGYCAQTPWLQSMSIRDNILFSAPYNDIRYRQVLAACALTEDLASLKHGDLSNIGENGIGLSGGQKARVALARAVYSQASILLLDDPISALDQQTAEFVVEKCFQGPLLAGRMVVLVTHRTDICARVADQMVEIRDGRAEPVDLTTSLSSRSEYLEESQEDIRTDRHLEQEVAAVPERFIEDEYRATGGVKARVYWEYVKAGKLHWWAVLVTLLVLYRLAAVVQTWFLKQWGEGYQQSIILAIENPFDRFPPPGQNIKPWLVAFLVLAIAQAMLYLISRGAMLVIVYISGRRMFRDIMRRITHATFRFYDVTPVGRLMNRLTSDIGTIDGNISELFHNVSWQAIVWISSLVVIAPITPVFLAFSLILTAGFVVIFLRFLPTSQSLRRLEMVSLSPLLSNFGALSEGLTTVRAFGAQKRFLSRVISVTDDFQKMDHFYWSLQAWLMYRFDMLSATSTFFLTLLALYTGVSPGLTAFALVAASNFVTSTHELCKQYGQLQMDFVSVERVVEMLHLEQEPSGTFAPPAWWPSYNGDIVLEDVTIRYGQQFDPALKNVSLRIKAGSNTAIMGRTGSGKSTLALALLATILPESGRILIDNIDISRVDNQALRSRITFLAQDPLLFPGTLRQNLDPLYEHSDAECDSVLAKVNASTACPVPRLDQRDPDRAINQHYGQQVWKLDTPISTGGRNLSQGQRQLVGLARAILRRSPIVILDEATASVDLETALQIQRVLRQEMAQSTIITIAHRAEAVEGVERIIRLDGGRVVEGSDPD